MLATFANFRVRSVTELTEGHAIDAQVVFQVVSWLCFGMFAAWAVLRGRANRSLISRGPLAWYLGFIMIALLSAAYSPSPALSAFTAAQHGVALVLVISLGKRLRHLLPFVLMYILVNWLLVLLGALHINFGLSWITAPEASRIWTDEPSWRFASAFGHPSQIGIVAAAAFLMMPGRSRSSFGRAAWMTLTVLTLLLTVSRTAIAGFAVGLLLIIIMRRRIILLCLGGWLIILAILVGPSRSVITAYITRGQSGEDMASLTGRVPIYEDAISRVEDHWAFGQGFLSTRVLLLNDQGDGNGTVHPHNLLLAALTGMGIGGAVLALGSILSLFATVIKLLRRTRDHPGIRQQALSCAASVMPLAAFCILDAGFAAKMSPFVLLYLVSAARAQDMLNSIGRVTPPHFQTKETFILGY
jgi:O-antigen ligase